MRPEVRILSGALVRKPTRTVTYGAGFSFSGRQVRYQQLAGVTASDTELRASTKRSYAHELSALSRRAHAPIIIASEQELARRLTFTRSIVEHGGAALTLVHGPASSWLDVALDTDVRFAWQIDETCTDPSGDAEQILQRAGRLEYVRLVGGGPEAALQEGRGVGAVMRQLTLAGYSGPIILTPSSPRYRIIWSAWLGRRGGWGCGSKVAGTDRTMTTING